MAANPQMSNDADTDTEQPMPESWRMMELTDRAALTAGHPGQAIKSRDAIADGLLQVQQLIIQHMTNAEAADVANQWLQYIWGQSEIMSGLVGELTSVSAEAMAITNDALAQRNAAVQALEELTEAIDSGDMENRVVRDLAEWLKEELSENMEEYWRDSAFEMVNEDIAAHLQIEFDLEPESAERFASVVMGWQSMTPTVARDMVDWLKHWVEKAMVDQSSQSDGAVR